MLCEISKVRHFPLLAYSEVRERRSVCMTEITVQIVEGGSKWQRQVSVRVKNCDKLDILMKVSWRMLKQNWNVKGKYLRAVGIVSREGKCFRYMRTRHRVRTEEWSGVKGSLGNCGLYSYRGAETELG